MIVILVGIATILNSISIVLAILTMKRDRR
jgi:hypothetical protein